jgi:hypothetical protein
MDRIVVVENDFINDTIEDVNTFEVKNKSKNKKDKTVRFENIYEEIQKLSSNYELQNTNNILTNRPNKNKKFLKREAIWFDK